MGFRVSGKAVPKIVKPVPATAAELTVTADDPVDVSVNVCVVAVFTFTFPNDRLDGLTFRLMAAASSCTPAVCVTPAAVALRVAD